MRIDNYTKFLLTVICFCLVCLCVRDLLAVPKVHADLAHQGHPSGWVKSSSCRRRSTSSCNK